MLRGDSAAIADARAMVEAMGGAAVWRELKSVHFVHEWDLHDRAERYLENEILDLTAPRSWVTMESETYSRLRAYSPEHRYWNVVNGTFAYTSDRDLANALERAPFSIYRIARGIAANDGFYHVRRGPMPDMAGVTALVFSGGQDTTSRGWIVLNRRGSRSSGRPHSTSTASARCSGTGICGFLVGRSRAEDAFDTRWSPSREQERSGSAVVHSAETVANARGSHEQRRTTSRSYAYCRRRPTVARRVSVGAGARRFGRCRRSRTDDSGHRGA
jgi:hypothetical protein